MKAIYHIFNSSVVFKALKDTPGFKNLFWKTEALKKKGAMKILDTVIKGEIEEKYSNIDLSTLNTVGNKVWMFWYTGFDTAPELVKKCLEKAKQVEGIDLVLLDKNNLLDYFTFEGNIKKYLDNGNIPLVKLSNIMRTQLITRHGGLWCDATVFITHPDLINRIKDLKFFTLRHSKGWHFSEGRWSGYFTGGGIGNPITGFLYDTLVKYYDMYDYHFDYFQFDYTWYYAYTHFDWARQLIDGVPGFSKDLDFLQHNWDKPYDESVWDAVIQNNEAQKLNWKANKTPEDRSIDTMGLHFLNL